MSTSFLDLGIAPMLLKSLEELGYETPSPIQEASIPVLLSGKDLLAQAQTGTGKTAAFALPILTKIDLSRASPQALILTNTRELAIQVAEAFHRYSKGMPGFRVLPIYGGNDYRTQFKALKSGVHVVVGTPGRIMDHLERKTLVLDALHTVVLDEADEMLNMGFIDDVKYILNQVTGAEHQTALFSATLPSAVKNIANEFLKDPVRIHMKREAATESLIEQYGMVVSNEFKLEALTRYLEVEDFDGVLIFSRTKTGAQEIADKLEARGYSVSALTGDMNQAKRESVMKRIRSSSLDIVVATEVAARGLDVNRISHVINYDIPYDVDSYIHRIGRTGRAGRQGKAMLFTTPREQRMVASIERATGTTIKMIKPPSINQVNEKRTQQFSDEILNSLQNNDITQFRTFIKEFADRHDYSLLDIASAIAALSEKAKLLSEKSENFIHKNDTGISDRKYRDKKFGGRKSGGFSGSDRRSEGGRGRSDRDKGRSGSDRNRSDRDRHRSSDRPRGDSERSRPSSDRSRGDFERNRSSTDRPRGDSERSRPGSDRSRGDSERSRSSSDHPRGNFEHSRSGSDRYRGDSERSRSSDRPRGDKNRKRSDSDRSRPDRDRQRSDSDRGTLSLGDLAGPTSDGKRKKSDRSRSNANSKRSDSDRYRPGSDRHNNGPARPVDRKFKPRRKSDA